MLFKYMNEGKEIAQVIKNTMSEAKQYAKENGIDWETIDEYEEPKGVKVGTKEPNVTDELEPQKKRKPRADKGTKRGTVEMAKHITKSLTEKSRRKPRYFIIVDDNLSFSGEHDSALGYLRTLDDKDKVVFVIMGHEIKFTRKVQFHF
jgi:hypothetical protein